MSNLTYLEEIDPDEVSPVRRGANRRPWSFLKSDDELDPELADVLALPHDREGALVTSLQKADVELGTQRAAVAVARLAQGFGLDLEQIAKAAGSQGDDPADKPTGDGDADDLAKAKALPASTEEPEDGEGHQDTPAEAKSRKKRFSKESPAPAGDVTKNAELAAGDNKKEQHMSDVAAPAVPIRKEDGSWDLSGVPDEARGFYESVLKAADTSKAEADSLREDVKKAQADADTANGLLREREFVAKADSEFGKVAPKEELGAILKAAHDTMAPEQVEKLEEILKSANAKIEAGDLFAELGQRAMGSVQGVSKGTAVHDASDGDAWGKIEKGAAELIEKASGALTKEQGVARFLKTADGQSLYADYLADYYGGVR